MKEGKYRGWKKGVVCGFDLGNNKVKAIKEAKAKNLDMVLKIGNRKEEGFWIYEKN